MIIQCRALNCGWNVIYGRLLSHGVMVSRDGQSWQWLLITWSLARFPFARHRNEVPTQHQPETSDSIAYPDAAIAPWNIQIEPNPFSMTSIKNATTNFLGPSSEGLQMGFKSGQVRVNFQGRPGKSTTLGNVWTSLILTAHLCSIKGSSTKPNLSSTVPFWRDPIP